MSFDIVAYLQYKLCCQSVYSYVYIFRIQKGSMPAITSSHQDPKQVIKNNTIEILMIYTHVFDNDILTFHYTTPFSNYESL
jgi:hypothetical protein